MPPSKGRFRRVLRWLGRLALAAIIIALVSTAAFLLTARTRQRDFQPLATPLPPGLEARIKELPKYRRAEDATYLTFPEWYLVFCPQEYAAFIARDRPSHFPYFRAIGQIWGGYAEVYGLTRRHYPLNEGYNLMLAVICTSSTVEFGLKGVYEETIGRVFEWTASARTPEDDFAATVAREYGDFIPTQPWFEFPFWSKFKGLWSQTNFFGPNFLRKCERKFFLSLEYGVKAGYAGVIRLASRAVFGVADTEVQLTARHVSDAAFALPGVRRVEAFGRDRWILAVPHYQGFTDTVPQLARAGVDFDEVAGNDEIMVTLIVPADWKGRLPGARPLFSQPLLTGENARRISYQVPVASLGELLRAAAAENLRVEHLFDY